MMTPLAESVLKAIERLNADVRAVYPDAVTIVVIHPADNRPVAFASTVPPDVMLDVFAHLADAMAGGAELVDLEDAAKWRGES